MPVWAIEQHIITAYILRKISAIWVTDMILPCATAPACYHKGVVLFFRDNIGPPAAAAVALRTHARHAATEHPQPLPSLHAEQAAHDGTAAAIPAREGSHATAAASLQEGLETPCCTICPVLARVCKDEGQTS